MSLDDEERMARFIEQQIQRDKEQGVAAKEAEYTELKRDGDEKLVLGGFKKPDAPVAK